MGTGFRGTFVISWSQTEIDGLDSPPVKSLTEGAAWSWRGDPVQIDGPNDVLRLDDAEGAEELRKRAARTVRRLVGVALEQEGLSLRQRPEKDSEPLPLMDNSFVVTDGARSYCVTLIELGQGKKPLLMFFNEMPPRNHELWVVHHSLNHLQLQSDGNADGGVICFTPGTRLRTAQGSIAIEDLREGDLVQTKDNGLQPVRWIGSRWMSGARLFAMPHLRPIRLRRGMLGQDEPDADLIVSPEHRLLIRGPVAQELFNTSEVLVKARDLVGRDQIKVDLRLREITYIHLLFDHHQILWANNVETESFHPASAALSSLGDLDRKRLFTAQPELASDPHTYGPFARRNLSASEAAILLHAS